MTTDFPHVGRGWAFPPRWVRAPGDPGGAGASGPGPLRVVMTDGERHVAEAMTIVLRTALGSRVMRPRAGAGVDRYVFEPRTAEVCYRLADDVRRALLLGEPRVIVEEVTAVPAGAAEDRVDVDIRYRIDRHRPPRSLVVPFYLAGAA